MFQTREIIRAARGVTLIETCVALAVIAVLMGLAIPSFADALARHRVESTTQQFRTDLAFARSQAVLRSSSVRLDVLQTRRGSCYVIHQGAPCRCGDAGEVICEPGGESLRSAFLPLDRGVTLTANVSGMTVDGARQTVSPTATVTVTAARVGALKTVISVVGRSRVCSAGFIDTGYRKC